MDPTKKLPHGLEDMSQPVDEPEKGSISVPVETDGNSQ